MKSRASGIDRNVCRFRVRGDAVTNGRSFVNQTKRGCSPNPFPKIDATSQQTVHAKFSAIKSSDPSLRKFNLKKSEQSVAASLIGRLVSQANMCPSSGKANLSRNRCA